VCESRPGQRVASDIAVETSRRKYKPARVKVKIRLAEDSGSRTRREIRTVGKGLILVARLIEAGLGRKRRTAAHGHDSADLPAACEIAADLPRVPPRQIVSKVRHKIVPDVLRGGRPLRAEIVSVLGYGRAANSLLGDGCRCVVHGFSPRVGKLVPHIV